MKKVEIITIGDELLIGQVVDTNSAWIARELNKIGLDLTNIVTVGDNEREIEKAFDRAFLRSSIILVTGGIGPTKDDITKKTLCKYFDCRLLFNGEVLHNIETIFKRSGRAVNPLTYSQAYVPEVALVIQNQVGTAPATWFEQDGKVLISMPGVPFEMKWLMSEEILPRLKNLLPENSFIDHHTIWVEGYAESELAMLLENFEENLPASHTLAYLPNSGVIRLRLTGHEEDKTKLDKTSATLKSQLLHLLGGHILMEGEGSLEHYVGVLLKEKGLSLGLAESCTGGYIASRISAIPGCSSYFKGGVIAYSNEIKIDSLHVNPKDIFEQGVVSETVVKQMVQGAKSVLNVDCAIASSGIAGPSGGTEEKPVGTIWIAVAVKDQLQTVKLSLSNSREGNIARATNQALLSLIKLLKA